MEDFWYGMDDLSYEMEWYGKFCLPWNMENLHFIPQYALTTTITTFTSNKRLLRIACRQQKLLQENL